MTLSPVIAEAFVITVRRRNRFVNRADGRSCEHDAENDFRRLEPVRHKQDEQAEQAEGPGRARMKYSNSRR
jgi:hypothetical protein